jgi:hypothetical protein
MITSIERRWTAIAATLLAALLALSIAASGAPAQAPPLTNPGFECTQGFAPQDGIVGLVPAGWTATRLAGNPKLNSTRIEFAGSCEGSGFIERLEGIDSLVILAEDIEEPPEPGKPFDVALTQQVTVTEGVAYSLSGWLVSFCGGSAMPNDCPDGYAIAKLAGLDPTGSLDPGAASVVWAEDRRNFTESRWANLRLGATAQGMTLTVFARIASPFQWHGAHAIVDAFSLVEAPTAHFVDLPAAAGGLTATVRWDGALSPDIAAIPAGNYHLRFDIQTRGAGQPDWADWLVDQPAGEATFTAAFCAPTQEYEFRVRARAEQPEGVPGAFPNHRYPGVWSAPAAITFVRDAPCPPRAYLPLVVNGALEIPPNQTSATRPRQ